MSPIHFFCAFAVLFLSWSETHGQTCVPGPVLNLTVTSAKGLTWAAPTENNCTISNYLVTVRKDGDPSLLYYVATPTLNVSTLEMCERYEFSVTAVTSDHVQGLETILSTKTPPQGMNLTVDVLNATQTNQNVLLSWSMKSGVEKCVDSFRLVIWDEDTEVPNDIYIQDTSFVLENVVPCMKYEYEIRAIFGTEEDGDPIYVNLTASAVVSSPPTLANINQGVTNVNMTWNLPTYATNRCPITGLLADASPNFNVTYTVDDSPERTQYFMMLDDLQPNTIYLCRVYVINSAGLSSPLAIAVQTLPGSSNSTFEIERHPHRVQLHQLLHQ